MKRATTWLTMIGLIAMALTAGSAGSNNNRPGQDFAAGNKDAPEISRSRGTVGSVVVLWPRIIPGSGSAESQWLARAVQERLRVMVQKALPGRAIDIRPAPERVCPMSGCDAIAVGALLMREQDGCAVVALVSRPGPTPTLMVPWAGDVRLRVTRVPFRQPPENWVTITDFGMCDRISSDLQANEGRIIEAIRDMAR